MSDGETSLTLEALLVEGTDPPAYACIKCGVPKKREQFEGDSIACKRCASIIASNQIVTEEILAKTKFDLAVEQLQDEQEPAIPNGVKRAHQILGGKTSTEIYAEMIHEITTGKNVKGETSWIPRDPKLLRQVTEGLQRAEIKHDEFLRNKPPEANISYEESQSLAVDTFIVSLTRDKELRLKVLGILLERCPELIDELMAVANVTVLPVQPSPPKPRQKATIPELENGGVI